MVVVVVVAVVVVVVFARPSFPCRGACQGRCALASIPLQDQILEVPSILGRKGVMEGWFWFWEKLVQDVEPGKNISRQV